MKRTKIIQTKRYVLSAFLFLWTAGLAASTLVKTLDEGWHFRQARLTNWYPATVPGVVHTDLIDNGIIDDPFFRLNERGVQWVDKEDWIYETTFDVAPEMLHMHNLRLHFKGLDTYADIFLNDEKILTTDNMFREWTIPVKDKLKARNNSLRIYFYSPIRKDMPKWNALPFRYEACNDQSENGGLFNMQLSVFARKAGYHYGWDWGPRLVTSGIWRPVLLEAWDGIHIENIHIKQQYVSAQRADIRQQVEVMCDQEVSRALVRVSDKKSGRLYAERSVTLKPGTNVIELDYTIRKPRLWWCNGLGESHLYDFQTTVSLPDGAQDTLQTSTGLRKLELVREEDGQGGRSFYFRLNGIPVFAKGANYIPCDNFLPRISRETYQQTVLDAAHANMNMLRVWGGGIYEDDYFYELCDRHGILVWQDFMFACSLYPADDAFLRNVRAEAADNLRRLRNHPSIALWCGNNECLEAWYGWGWKERYERQSAEYARLIWKQYEDLFHHLLPEMVEEYSPNTPYIPSSPFSRYDGVSESERGDTHYWDVWQGRKPLSEYNTARSRFFSEYGYQSFPSPESVRQYAPRPEDHEVTSEVMMAHQRGGEQANNLIKTALNAEYGEPRDFDAFLYMSQLLQGDVIKMAIEAHRRDKPHCMGTLFWQHNDCWPVASWSSRDYYGRWKAQHYFARQAYRDLLVSPIITDTGDKQLQVFIVSDRLETVRGSLMIEAVDMQGGILGTHKIAVNILANSSRLVFEQSLKTLLPEQDYAHTVIIATLSVGNGESYTNHCFPAPQQAMRYPVLSEIDYELVPADGGYDLLFDCSGFARGVYLALEETKAFFSDNFFDLVPGRERKIHIDTDLSESEFRRLLKIRSLSECRIRNVSIR